MPLNGEKLLLEFPTVTYDAVTDSYIVPRDVALPVAEFLKSDAEYRLDMPTNVTGVDWLPGKVKIKKKVREVVEGVEKEVEKEFEEDRPGYLETVYHLISVELRQGPLTIRIRTKDREHVMVPSLTPIWRGCELQEREAYDLFGIVYEGHPDLRRILMWEGFKDYPMRKDYKEPDDYDYEPTPHDDVLEKTRKHYPTS